MARQARMKSSSGIYHIILRGINRQVLFEEEESKEKFLDTIRQYKQKSGYQVIGYCIMDNHIHLLIKQENEPLENTMKRIGVSYAYWYNWEYNRTGHLFQDRYKSEPIEDDGYLLAVLRCIHQNPLIAELVKDMADYKWSSYSEYLAAPKIVDTSLVLGMFSNNKQRAKELFCEYMKESAENVFELEKPKRLSDQAASEAIQKVISPVTLGELRQLEKDKREQVLRRLKGMDGLSIRQIARITGVTVNVVGKA